LIQPLTSRTLESRNVVGGVLVLGGTGVGAGVLLRGLPCSWALRE